MGPFTKRGSTRSQGRPEGRPEGRPVGLATAPSAQARWQGPIRCAAGPGRWRCLLSSLALISLVPAWAQENSAIDAARPVAAPAECAGNCLPKTGRDPCADLQIPPGAGQPRPGSPDQILLITGGSGFIGSHLVEMLLQLNYTVRVYDNLETGNVQFLDFRHPRLQFVLGDIMDLDTLRSAMEGVVGVFHLGAASKVLPSLKDPAMATFNLERNAVGTSRVLEVANETKLVRKVLYAASSTYYGNQDVPFRETDPFLVTSPYSASKYMGELAMETHDGLYGLPTLSLRFFMVYGPRNPSKGAYAIVTGKFLDRYRDGLPLLIEGSGSNFRDFVHVRDVARALILGLQSEVRGTSINIGTGQTHSIKDVANLVSSHQEHIAAREKDLIGTMADTCRARKLLQFEAEYDFVAVMKDMIEDAKRGSVEYLAPMWELAPVKQALDIRIPHWSSRPSAVRSELVRDALKLDPKLLDSLVAAAGGKFVEAPAKQQAVASNPDLGSRHSSPGAAPSSVSSSSSSQASLSSSSSSSSPSPLSTGVHCGTPNAPSESCARPF